jgi:hypothetical protein
LREVTPWFQHVFRSAKHPKNETLNFHKMGKSIPFPEPPNNGILFYRVIIINVNIRFFNNARKFTMNTMLPEKVFKLSIQKRQFNRNS